MRVADDLAITAIPASRLGHVIKAVKKAGCDMVVIDTPPYAREIAYEAAKHADYVLPSRSCFPSCRSSSPSAAWKWTRLTPQPCRSPGVSPANNPRTHPAPQPPPSYRRLGALIDARQNSKPAAFAENATLIRWR